MCSGPGICVGVAGNAKQGGSAAAEWHSVDRALCEDHRSAGSGKSTPGLHHRIHGKQEV